MQSLFVFAASLMLGLAAVQLHGAEQQQKISETAISGDYTITLKVLPAEAFKGPNAEMVWDGGAEPNYLAGPKHPNHHLVTFVIKGRAPMENGDVSILYRRETQKNENWTSLPVARMHVKGKGPETTHFGNNVQLEPGKYEVKVSVNHSSPAIFHFAIEGK